MNERRSMSDGVEGGAPGYEDDILEQHYNDLLEMFEEQSFSEKWRRVRSGLRLPSSSGAHKWARLQLLRLLSPVAAVVVPLLILVLIVLISKIDCNHTGGTFAIQIIEPEKIDGIEPLKEPEPVDIPQPDIDVPDFQPPEIDSPPVPVAAPTRDVTTQRAPIDSVAITKCMVKMTTVYSSRTPGARAAALHKYNACRGSDEAVLRALRYLKTQQAGDGSWGNHSRVAMTSLAVLAYLAHGDTPATSDEFGGSVRRGLEYIMSKQKSNGHFYTADGHDYTQPIAAYALAEAFSLTSNPRVKHAAVKALMPVVNGQNPGGGFNYNLMPTNTRDDTSYMGWCVQALKSGKLAGLGDKVPGLHKCMDRAVNGFCRNYGETAGYGGFGYTGPGKPNSGLTGVGVLCLQFLGAANRHEFRAGLRAVDKWGFAWGAPEKYGRSFLYYMYYATQVRFQQGGSAWQSWNKSFGPQLVQHQDVIGKEQSGYVDGCGQRQAIGSWISPSKGEHNGGEKIMDTLMCTLMLEVYYRYLPSFERLPDINQLPESDPEEDIPNLEFSGLEQGQPPGTCLVGNRAVARL